MLGSGTVVNEEWAEWWRSRGRRQHTPECLSGVPVVVRVLGLGWCWAASARPRVERPARPVGFAARRLKPSRRFGEQHYSRLRPSPPSGPHAPQPLASRPRPLGCHLE